MTGTTTTALQAERTTGATGDPHSLFEDAYALFTGCFFAVFGLIWLKAAGLVTGGLAGLALLVSYLIPWPEGMLFAFLNLPFLFLGRRVLGTGFLTKALSANLLISVFALGAPSAFRIEEVNGVFAALFGGTLIGVGLLQLARHEIGLGGLGILALVWQKSRGWNAGRTMMAADTLILAASLPILAPGAERFTLSVASAIATAGVLIVFHKPGRYTGG